MNNRKIAICIFISLFLLSGCSLFKKSTASTSKTTNSSTKTTKTSSTTDYDTALSTVQQDYKTKRDQAEQDRTRAYNDSLTAQDQDRIAKVNTLINDINKELTARNADEISKINNAYNSAITDIGQEILSADEKQSAIQKATNTKSGNLFNQQTSYFNQTSAAKALKRNYDAKIQAAKDTRAQDEASFKKECSAKYDKLFAKITSAYGGSGTQWEVLLAAEQKEMKDFYDQEDAKYNDKVNALDSWLKESMGALLN